MFLLGYKTSKESWTFSLGAHLCHEDSEIAARIAELAKTDIIVLLKDDEEIFSTVVREQTPTGIVEKIRKLVQIAQNLNFKIQKPTIHKQQFLCMFDDEIGGSVMGWPVDVTIYGRPGKYVVEIHYEEGDEEETFYATSHRAIKDALYERSISMISLEEFREHHERRKNERAKAKRKA